MRRKLLTASLLFLVLTCAPPSQAGDRKERNGTVQVECTRGSAFVTLTVNNYRRIGRVVIEVKNAEGKLLYKEVGKAMDDVLVRRLDKGVFSKGDLTITVAARDLSITQVFTVR